MKQFSLLLILISLGVLTYGQENRFTLSGGYAFTNVEESETSLSGYRINGLYEFSPMGGKVSHGLSVGFIGTSGTNEEVLNQTTEYKINAWPIYWAPKYTFGESSVKGFVKGALGWQFSGIKRTTSVTEFSDNDSGFYGGAGAGVLKEINDKIFVNLEYEWAYLSNSFYRDGFMNTINLGVGIKF